MLRGEKMNKNVVSRLMILVVVVMLALSACAPAATPTAAPVPTNPPAPAATAVPPTAVPPTAVPATDTAVPPTAVPATAVPATVAPTAAPTAPPAACAPIAKPITPAAGALGSPDKPITITFVPSGDTGKLTPVATDIADCLTKMTGLTFGIEFGTSFGASIESMGAGKAQVGFLNTFSVLLAEAKYGIVPVLANERAYSTVEGDPDAAMKGQLEPFYKAEFLANSASGIKSFADLKGKTFCFVDPNSTSGYIVPRIILKAKGIDPDKDFKATVNAGSHPNVAIAVYKGDCDAGVAYIDIRTDATANLVATYPDIMTKVQVFAVSDRIPNDGVQVVKDFPANYTAALTEALLSMNGDPGGNALIKNLYNVNKFFQIDKTFYDPFAAVLKAAGVDPASMVK
jgi:phosphonate transport system substrate-binding protein